MARAHIFQINVSNGGVPKRAVRTAVVDETGITLDQQADERYHGGRDRALLIFALEHLLALQAEGHPIYAGSVGENVTISGLEWASLAPGARLRLGEVLVEVSGYATPCHKISASFAAGDIKRIAHKINPGWSRLTCRVLQPGRLVVGDGVTVVDRP